MPVQSVTPEAIRAAQAGIGLGRTGAQPTPVTTFAAQLAKTRTTTPATTGGTPGANTAPVPTETETEKPAVSTDIKRPRGESSRPVGKKPYEEILSGPRNGMFVNITQNERRGEAFVLVKRPGRDLHIYGSGEDRKIIVVWHDKDHAKGSDDKKSTPAADKGTGTGGATAEA